MRPRLSTRRLALLWLCFAASLSSAQGKSDAACLKSGSITPSYDALRQNNSIQMTLTFATSRCLLRFGHYGSREDANRVKVWLRRTPGLTPRLTSVSFLGIQSTAVAFADLSKPASNVLSRDSGARGLELQINLQSSADLAVGHYQIPVYVEFVAVGAHGDIRTEALPLEIPLEVVLADAPVKEHVEKHPMTVTDVLLVPVRTVGVLWWLLCGFCND